MFEIKPIINQFIVMFFLRGVNSLKLVRITCYHYICVVQVMLFHLICYLPCFSIFRIFGYSAQVSQVHLLIKLIKFFNRFSEFIEFNKSSAHLGKTPISGKTFA